MTSRAIYLVVGLTIAFQLFIGYRAMRSAQALLQHRIQQIEALSHD